jgi:hypothetical protein
VGGPPGDVLDVRALGGYPADPATFLRGDGTFAAVPPPAPAPPLAHAPTHQAGGSDPVKLDDLAAPDDNGDLNASTTAHGLLQKLPGFPQQFLNGQGGFTVPPTNLHANSHRVGQPDQLDVTNLAGFPGVTDLFLRADGTFAAPAGGGGGTGTPGGATTQLQFNDAGAFAGDAALTYDKATKALALRAGPLSIGVIPATAGNINLPNTCTVAARNVANTHDVSFLQFWNDDRLYVGGFQWDQGTVIRSEKVIQLSNSDNSIIPLQADCLTGVATLLRPATKIGAGGVWDGPTATLTWDLATGAAFRESMAGGFNAQFINPPPLGVEFVFSVQIDWTGGPFTVTWPASVTWDEDVAPVMPGAGRTTILGFSTINGGVRWRGYIAGRNFLT